MTPVGLHASHQGSQSIRGVLRPSVKHCIVRPIIACLGRQLLHSIRFSQGPVGDGGYSGGGAFQSRNAAHGLFEGVTAYLGHRLPAAAEGRPFGFAIESAFIAVIQVGTARAGRFAVGHVGNSGGDRRCNAARAALPAVHHDLPLIEAVRRIRAERARVCAGQLEPGWCRCRSEVGRAQADRLPVQRWRRSVSAWVSTGSCRSRPEAG